MRTLRIIKSIRRLLFLNKLRVALTLIGIAVGITSVIIMVAIGEGAKDRMLSQIKSMGSNLITVDAGKVKEVIGRRRQTSKVTTLKEKDAEAISQDCNYVNAVAPTQEQMVLVKFENGSTGSRAIGTTPEYPAIRNYEIAHGRFFDDDDNKFSRRVAVVGDKVVRYLFRDINPIGETIRINNVPVEVIGVLKSKGASYDGADEDDVVFIPLNTGMRRLFNVDYIKNIYVQVSAKDKIENVEEEIRSILREKHRLNVRNKEDDFTLQNTYTALKTENDAGETFTDLITGVAALSLLVGGVGILAIMFLSVKERRPEIGLRIAIGGRPVDILLQFLLEAVILSMAGGIIGILLGWIGAKLLGMFTELATSVSLESITVSVAVSIIIGVTFGAFPAWRASQLTPREALMSA